MGKLKTIRVLRVQNIYVWQGYLGPHHIEDCQEVTISPHNACDRNTEAAKLYALLLKEMQETSNWAHFASFGWFALLLTANALATGWVLTYNSTMPLFAPLVFGAFFVLNLMGIITSSRIHEHSLNSDRRIKEVIETLTRRYVTEDPCFKPQPPAPLQAINTAFRFTTATLVVLMLFWAALAIWWALLRLPG